MGTRFALAVALAGIVATVVGAQAGAALKQAQPTDYLVLYAEGASTASARLAVQAAGGTIVKENTAIGVATVRSQNVGFLSAVLRQPALAGAARNVPIGQGAPLLRPKDRNDETGEQAVSQGNGGGGNQHGEHTRTGDPLAGLQWNMAMIHATVDGSYQNQRGDRRVLVGILDTGIDASHPDIAPNVNAALSRNFTTDIPLIDGPCEDEPDHSCSDPTRSSSNGRSSKQPTARSTTRPSAA